MGSFNWIKSHQKILMQNTNKHRTKNSARENIDLFVQKKSETRLIGYQDNTPTHINDLITEKAKGQKNLDMVLSEVKTIQLLLRKLPNFLLYQLQKNFIFVSFIFLWLCSHLLFFLINLRILLFNKNVYFFIKILLIAALELK